VSPGDCKDVPGVDEACVNKALHIGSPGGGDFTDKFTDERIIVNNKNPYRHVTVPPVNLDPA
jgi:hypothetical protein